MFTVFQCLGDAIPGVFTGGRAGSGIAEDQSEEVNLANLGVRSHAVLGYSTQASFAQGRFDQRYFFLLPGRLVSSGEAFAESSEAALRSALVAEEEFCLDISPTLTVEMVNPRVFRVHNAESTVVAQSTPEPSSSESSSSDDNGKKSSSTLTPLAEGQPSLTIHFQSPEQAAQWTEALKAERERLYLPTLVLRDLEFCKELHAALWRCVKADAATYAEVRFLYFRCERGEGGPEAALIALYEIFARIVPKGQVSKCVPAFIELLTICVAHLTTRLCLLTWDITPAFLANFQAFYQPLLIEAEKKRVADAAAADSEGDSAAAATAAAPSTVADYLQKLVQSMTLASGAGSVDPQTVVELAKYIRRATSDSSFQANAKLLASVYGAAEGVSMSSVTHSRWLADLQAGKGSLIGPMPLQVSWAQAKLMLEPSPYCGYFFVDFFIENDDLRRARATCQLLPYSMSERFDALHVNGGTEPDHAAHFIAYLEWDALQRGYEEFEVKNRGNAKVLQLVSDARDVYSVPICTASHLDLAKMSAAEVMQDFISQLLDNVESEECKHVRCLRKVLGHWMTFTGKATGVVEVPRKAHLITLLLLSNWLAARPTTIATVAASVAASPPRSPLLLRTSSGRVAASDASSMVVGRVVEGEDRALILAIAATDMVLTHSKRVHILYSTAADLFRDFSRVKPYFAALGMSASLNDFSVATDITYCLQRDLTQYYRDAAYQGLAPLADTLLFIHDVATFSVGASPNAIYGKKDEELSGPFREYLDVLAAKSPEDAASPDSPAPPTTAKIGDSLQAAAWSKAKQGWAEFSVMEADKPLGYSVHGDLLVLLDAEGKTSPVKYSLGLECARYRVLGVEPSINSKFYFQSLPYILSSYQCVFGLDDLAAASANTPGASASGRDFLRDVLGAWSFNIPNDEAQKNFGSLNAAAAAAETSFTAADSSADAATSAAAPEAATPGSPRGAGDATLSLVAKGALMSELCDSFYKAFPHKGGAWPSSSEHRRLVQFLERDELHTAEGVAEFSASLRLGTTKWLMG